MTIAFFLLNTIVETLVEHPFLRRNLSAVVIAASVLAFVWLARSRKAALATTVRPSRSSKFYYYGLCAITGVLGSSLVANVFGFVILSEVMRQTVLLSGFVGLVTIVLVYSTISLMSAVLHTAKVGSLSAVRREGRAIEVWVARATGAVGFCYWSWVTLDLLDIRTETVGFVTRIMTTSLPLGKLSFSIGDLFAFLAILAAGYLVASAIRLTLCEDILSRFRLERGIPELISSAVFYVLLFCVFVTAVSAAGVNLDRFTLLTGALGVGLGFGLQNVVNNFVSGLILKFERPIDVGDVLDVGGFPVLSHGSAYAPALC